MRTRFTVAFASPSVALAALVGLAAVAGCARATGDPGEPTLEEVRTATEKYRDVSVALAEGYIADPSNSCETAETIGRPAEEGAMGLHYFRPDLLGLKGPPNPRVDGTGTHADFADPGVLVYEPQPDGSLELIAVENLVFRSAWEAAGNTEPPSYRDVPFDLMEDDPSTPVDEAHGFEAHYDLHLWLHRPNPSGMFEPFNPNVTCDHHTAGRQASGGQ